MSPHLHRVNLYKPVTVRERKPIRLSREIPISITPTEAPEGVNPSDVLALTAPIDFHFGANGQDHHTGSFEVMSRGDGSHLVIRRGQTFNVSLVFNRPYNPDTDRIAFTFSLDAAMKKKDNDSESDTIKPRVVPSICNGTFVLVSLEKEIKYPKSWNAVGNSEGNSLNVEIISPPDCIVGIWTFGVSTLVNTPSGIAYTFEPSTKIYTLFNTWCTDDQVYLDNDNERQEYVESDSGMVWRASTNKGMPWWYYQYEKDVLDCVMYLITDVASTPLISCNDPVKVSRGLSSAVNSNDNCGILFGKWYEPYNNGTEPWDWKNSKDIIQKYYENSHGTDRTPVRYGQCWVFASVLTTVCRAVGLPTRSVTCFGSAHDAEGNLTLDYVVDSSLREMENLTADSDWNFHVWNEVWMKRPDLPEGDYDGWNAIDSTPQEESEGLSRCGPASVKAIQRGEVLLPYDTDFLFGEVNAVKNFWKYTSWSQPLKLLFSEKNQVGWEILTKRVGSYRANSIVDNYKYNSDEPLKFYPGVTPKFHDKVVEASEKKAQSADITIDVDVDENNIYIGKPVRFTVVVSNKCKINDYTVKLTTRVDSMTYRGILNAQVKTSEDSFVIAHSSEHKATFEISYEEYFSKLVDHNQLRVLSVADIQETGFEYVASKILSVEVPSIDIEFQQNITQGREFWTTAKVNNTLPTALTNCKFQFEGVGMSRPVEFFVEGQVQPGENATANVSLVPRLRRDSAREGTGNKSVLSIFFSCNQLKMTQGFVEFWINNA